MSAQKIYDLIVIGGGAAGFFGAIQAAENDPSLRILILEKSGKLLSKVKISGGGRCNVTHHCFEPTLLSKHYPRGQRGLKKIFRTYQSKDVVTWFQSQGVKLKTEEDGRMFPQSDRSETIINCFLKQIDTYGIEIKTDFAVSHLGRDDNYFVVSTATQKKYVGSKVLITVGGNPKYDFYNWIAKLGHSIKAPVPSLFTFNDSLKKFKDLMGVAVEDCTVQVAGTKLRQGGPVLITHWGLSGPAVLKLSAWGAEHLARHNYVFTALVNWVGGTGEDEVRGKLMEYAQHHPKQKIQGNTLFHLPQRLWIRFCELAEIDESRIWSEISKKQLNRLVEHLVRCPFEIKGKTTFKEEFVTCGGVPLDEVNLETMESKKVRDVYFAGEVLDIDGETGGFNFQSAWSTSYIAARSIATRKADK